MTNPHKGKSLAAFYAVGGLRELIPIYPLYSIMFGMHGVGPFELSVLFIIWASVGLILEIPSGALADTYSRKWLVVASGLLKSGAFLAWYFWQDFWGYAFGFVLWGIGSSLRSGAFEALLFEVLDEWQETSRFAFHYGRIRALATGSIMIGEASGGLLIAHGFDIVLLISAAVPLVVSLPFCFWVKDVRTDSTADYTGNLIGAVMEVRGNPTLIFILGLSTLLLTVHGIFDEYVPPLFLEQGFSIAAIAFLAIPVFSAQALGEYLADRFMYLSFKTLLNVMAVGAATLSLASVIGGVPGVVAVTLFFFLFGLAGTITESKLQAQIGGDSRATITSLIGWGDSLGAIFWFALFGLASDYFNFGTGTLMLGLTTVGLCLAAQRNRLIRAFKDKTTS